MTYPNDQPDFGDDFETEDPEELEKESSQEETFQVDEVSTGTCQEGDCSLGPHPAQKEWLELMSAVPEREMKDSVLPEAQEYLTPPAGVMRDQLNAVRPSDAHAIAPIAYEWDSMRIPLNEIHEELKTNLTTLAGNWEGQDYDTLEEKVNELRKYIADTVETIDDVYDNLIIARNETYAAQGGDGEATPYPQAEVYVHEKSWRNDIVHVRPPWHEGDCHTMKAKEASSKLDSMHDYDAEFHEYEVSRVDNLMNADPDMTRSEAESIADEELQEAADEIKGTVDRERMAYAETVNSAIQTRHTNADNGVASTRFQNEPGSPTFGSGEGDGELPPGLEGAGGGMTPPGAGAGDLGALGGEPGVDLPDPSSPPGGGAGGGMPSTRVPGGGPGDGPGGGGWDLPNGDDEDDWGGGLQSGGGIGGGGGGIGAGGIGGGAGAGAGGIGAGAGAGAGGMVGAGAGAGGRMGGAGAGAGGRMGGGAGAGGAGAGRGMGGGSGSGSGGRGAGGGRMGGGMGMMPMGGAGAGGGKQDGESKNDDWLHEEDDVWGIGNEEDDPFA